MVRNIMLSKIINIAAGSDYKKSNGSGNQNKFLRRNPYSSFQFHDSIVFSPALQYLTNVQWRLKEISNLSKGKLAVSFVASDFEFQTVVDLPNIESLKSVDYRIIKENSLDDQDNKILVEVEVKIEGVVEDNLPQAVTLETLQKLFNRLFVLKIENQLNKTNSVMLTEIIGDLLADLKTEFDSVNNQLFNFIEKLTELKITGVERFDNMHLEPLKINLIKSLKKDS